MASVIIPQSLRDRLQAEADKNGRSFADEVAERLSRSFSQAIDATGWAEAAFDAPRIGISLLRMESDYRGMMNSLNRLQGRG